MSAIHDQCLALAGLFQSCYLVDRIAQHGQSDLDDLETSVGSLFVTNPSSAESVYNSRTNLRTGLRLLEELLGKDASSKQAHWVRYALAIMHIHGKLRKNPDMLDEISRGLARAESAKTHFGLSHENTFAALADTYQKTISTFPTRIQVNGDPHILKAEHNAAKIRTLLLAGLRSAMLWKQVGGHRWHLLFKRKALVDAARELQA